MGFLDHATNNIIVDAVLTDFGRQSLARNDGSFNITKFSFCDDEVDYNIIKKFGRTVGVEKVIKNTPVQEANPDAAQAIKHRLVTLAIPNLDQMTTVEIQGDSAVDTSGTIPVVTVTKNKQVSFSLNQTTTEDLIPQVLRNNGYRVYVDNRFISLNNVRPGFIDKNSVATYNILKGRAASKTTKGGAILNLTLRAKAITDTNFNIYGSVGLKTQIKTYLITEGLQDGVRTYFTVKINKT